MRTLLLALSFAAVASPAAATTAAAQAPAGREQTADQQVLHALNRLAFGPRPGEAASVRAMGVDKWIEQQLLPGRDAGCGMQDAKSCPRYLSNAELTELYRRDRMERRRAARTPQSNPQSAARTPQSNPQPAARRPQSNPQSAARSPQSPARTPQSRDALRDALTQVEQSKLVRAVVSDRQLDELMADFWANHFSVFKGKGLTRLYIGHYDRDVIRPHAMGRFRDLLGAVAKSPAMLFYLDNARSVAEVDPAAMMQQRRAMQRAAQRRGTRQPQRQPANRSRGLNENYARELLELHTLGVDGGYTQADVREVARAFTGWSIDPQQGEFIFRRAAHERGPMQVLGRTIDEGGIQDGEAVLDLVASHPATARHIARKLVVRFVSDSPPPALVERAAATFTRTDGDIREVMRTIVTSDEFFSSAAWRAKVKTPFELVASSYRALGAVPDTTPRATQLLARLGQPIYGRQTPDGWPDTADEWMTAGAVLNRINFGLLVAGGRLPGARLQDAPVISRMRDAGCGMRNAARDACVDIVVRELLGGAVSVETRSILTSGANPLLARGDERRGAMNAMRDSTRVSARGLQLSPVQQLVGLALGAPEFQRR